MESCSGSELTDDGEDELMEMLFTEDEIVNAVSCYKTQHGFKEKPFKNRNDEVTHQPHYEHNYTKSSKAKGILIYLHRV